MGHSRQGDVWRYLCSEATTLLFGGSHFYNMHGSSQPEIWNSLVTAGTTVENGVSRLPLRYRIHQRWNKCGSGRTVTVCGIRFPGRDQGEIIIFWLPKAGVYSRYSRYTGSWRSDGDKGIYGEDSTVPVNSAVAKTNTMRWGGGSRSTTFVEWGWWRKLRGRGGWPSDTWRYGLRYQEVSWGAGSSSTN